MTENKGDWGVDAPEETGEMSTSANTLYDVDDYNDGIVDPTYVNDIIDCSDLDIYPWGNS